MPPVVIAGVPLIVKVTLSPRLTLLGVLTVNPVISGVAGGVPSAALAGTTTRLRTNVRANSKERNFFM